MTEQSQALARIAGSIAHLRPSNAAEVLDMTEHPYVVTGNLARWLVENRSRLADAELRALFDAIEQQLLGGTTAVRELVAEGLLEDLQNLGAKQGTPDEAWLQHLGTRTLQTWRLIQDMWAGRMTTADYRRRL
ncbi:MAG TPA: hypothetical protein VGP96_00130 [Candidatus Dormibacteraeota bacterium]|nr:hypothetical protein [Candidatus Dormibacteraeota bacterium]